MTPEPYETIRKALNCALGTHGDRCGATKPCPAMQEFREGITALDEMRKDTERLDWLFSLEDNGASVQQIEFLLMHTSGPEACRTEIDKFRSGLAPAEQQDTGAIAPQSQQDWTDADLTQWTAIAPPNLTPIATQECACRKALVAQFERDFYCRGDHQYSGVVIRKWLCDVALVDKCRADCPCEQLRADNERLQIISRGDQITMSRYKAERDALRADLTHREREFRTLSDDHEKLEADLSEAAKALEEIADKRCEKIQFDENGCADRIAEKFYCGPCTARAFVKKHQERP